MSSLPAGFFFARRLTSGLSVVPRAGIKEAAQRRQSVVHSKCGQIAFSNEKMAYTGGPCVGASDMTKAEMKQGVRPGYGYAQPMSTQQAQAVQMGPNPSMSGASMGANMAPPNMALGGDQCGPMNVATIKDEYGRRYNCRGDRIR